MNNNNKSNNTTALLHIYALIVTFILLATNVSANKRPAMDCKAGVKIPVEPLRFLSSSQSVRLWHASHQLTNGYQKQFSLKCWNWREPRTNHFPAYTNVFQNDLNHILTLNGDWRQVQIYLCLCLYRSVCMWKPSHKSYNSSISKTRELKYHCFECYFSRHVLCIKTVHRFSQKLARKRLIRTENLHVKSIKVE
jgi:hypothetical protein